MNVRSLLLPNPQIPSRSCAGPTGSRSGDGGTRTATASPHRRRCSWLVFLLLLCLALPTGTDEEVSKKKMSCAASGRFMYFAFGSNLLKERLQLKNPSATFCTTGRLKDYELNFGLWKQHVDNAWHGGVATIEFSPGAEVWGVIWTLSNENLTSLDNQEGVSLGIYSPLEVSVETDQGLILCRTYQMNNFHACPPSPQYKQVVCLGAEQNSLPVEYLKRLEVIETNNYSGPSILDQIQTPIK